MNAYTVTWGAPGNSWSLLLVVLMALLLVYRYRRSVRVAEYLAFSAHRARLLMRFSKVRLVAKSLLLLLGTLCIALSLLMPRWGKKEHIVQQEGRDVLIALDISRSMLACDTLPNRLACAKKKIIALLQHLSCERIGLILFSGSAFVQCPLTTDYGAFKLFLDFVDVESIASGSTALDQAITQALRVYETCPGRRNKLLVIFTDGEDFSENLATIKQEATRVGMQIFTLGIGTTQGAPIPLYDERGKQEGYQKNEKGAVVISRLDETVGRSLAREVGGTYLAMTDTDADVQTIAQRIAAFEKEKFDATKMSTLQEQYPYFIAVALVCFMIEWFL